MQSKRALRKTIRTQRRSLSTKELRSAELGIARSARQCRPLWQAKRVLSYAPFEGEISPSTLVSQLTQADHFLPRIINYRNCAMRIYSANSIDTFNRFGIAEPKAIGTPLAANQLDLILMPLVAFDRRGNRMGMGAGYYDRALQALSRQTSTKPLLVGLAHSFQEVEHLQAEDWDVPVDAILTEKEYIPIAT